MNSQFGIAIILVTLFISLAENAVSQNFEVFCPENAEKQLSSTNSPLYQERDEILTTLFIQLTQTPHSAEKLNWLGKVLTSESLEYSARYLLMQFFSRLSIEEQKAVKNYSDIPPFSAGQLEIYLQKAGGENAAQRLWGQYMLEAAADKNTWSEAIWHKTTELLNKGVENLDDYLFLEKLEKFARNAAMNAPDFNSPEFSSLQTQNLLYSYIFPKNETDDSVSRVSYLNKYRRNEQNRIFNAIAELALNEKNRDFAKKYLETLDLSQINGSNTSKKRYEELKNYLRPTLACEFWAHRSHYSTQYLIIGEPQINEGALQPSHFDSADDKTAHCVSGNNLSPGNHPVGVAISHPHVKAFFHLVNLPNPVRRLKYEDERFLYCHKRLAIITNNTYSYYKKQKSLSDAQITLTYELDASQFLPFFKWYVENVQDEYVKIQDRFTMPGNTIGWNGVTHKGYLCLVLSEIGGADSAKLIQKYIEEKRFLVADKLSAPNLPLISMFSLLKQNPTPENIAILESYLTTNAPFKVIYYERGDKKEYVTDLQKSELPEAEISAVALGILCSNKGISLSQIGLLSVPDSYLSRLNVDSVRFPQDRNPAEIISNYYEIIESIGLN